MRCSYVVGVVQEHFNVTVCRCPISGVVTDEEWRDQNGSLHRWEEPAVVRRDRDSGIVTEVGFFWRDQRHRPNGEPALLEYDSSSGKLIRRLWAVHGEYVRPDDLPHVEWLDKESGVVVRAEYLVKASTANGTRLHREAGPAVLLFDRITGEQIGSVFYRFGRKQGVPHGPQAGL